MNKLEIKNNDIFNLMKKIKKNLQGKTGPMNHDHVAAVNKVYADLVDIAQFLGIDE